MEENQNPVEDTANATPATPPSTPEPPQQAAPEPPKSTTPPSDDDMKDRLERLGGEPAPVITPEEFARLQQAGQVHIDSRGRVRTTRRSDAEAGVSLRKRRAWYGS